METKKILVVGSGGAGHIHFPPNIQAQIDKGEIIVIDNIEDVKRFAQNADVERLTNMQIRETKQIIDVLSEPRIGFAKSGKENRRDKRAKERRNKKFKKRK